MPRTAYAYRHRRAGAIVWAIFDTSQELSTRPGMEAAISQRSASFDPQHDSDAARSATMAWIPGGTFRMGSDRHYPEEAPVHQVSVDGFWMDRTPVTNREFRRFVAETGYVTFAEKTPDPKDYPGAMPKMLRPASLVFTQPSKPVDLRNIANWWRYTVGADWRHPYGPKSSISGLDDHPVVHVAYCDAE